jgi:hypothetical protein
MSNSNIAIYLTDVCYSWMCLLQGVINVRLSTDKCYLTIKDAHVVPLFKKDERHLASNNRPVSLTSITCKVMEHIVHSSVMGHFDRNKILTNAQHGFREKWSCEFQLIVTIHDIASKLERDSQVDIILLDFAKAFDKVPHHCLLIYTS